MHVSSFILFTTLLVGLLIGSGICKEVRRKSYKRWRADNEVTRHAPPHPYLQYWHGVEPPQKWRYVAVRENAFMFWWLYYTTAAKGYLNTPLVIWIQGGPGSSGTGFGNFAEMGPLDVRLQPRKTTWVNKASVLYVDNPVGTGYSYVTSEDAYTTDVDQIAQDLVTMLKAFLSEVPDFKTVPLYIFSESYGGKMTAAFGKALYLAVKAGTVNCNFKGVALGDSWISALDSVLTWGPYLYATSLVDKQGLTAINNSAMEAKKAFDAGDFVKSTTFWSQTEDVIENYTGGVNMYNILKWKGGIPPARSPRHFRSQIPHNIIEKLYLRHVRPFGNPDDILGELMNGPIRQKLGIIPENVTWGGQSGQVFEKQSMDFMKPVIDRVDWLLSNTDLQVAVYNGQLDLIVDTMGQERWVQKLQWSGLPAYNNATRTVLINNSTQIPWGYLKQHRNFSFYWILNAGHMVPADVGPAALELLNMIIGGASSR